MLKLFWTALALFYLGRIQIHPRLSARQLLQVGRAAQRTASSICG
ncbi:hypothetical protein [Nostoc sp. FACHB-280]|nr:hypothetical protein [Nostoc sp. FACHB-280]